MNHTLTLTAGGGAELYAPNGEIIWTSATDETFSAEFITVTANDLDAILEYLIDEGHLTEQQADETECEEESLDGDDIEIEE